MADVTFKYNELKYSFVFEPEHGDDAPVLTFVGTETTRLTPSVDAEAIAYEIADYIFGVSSKRPDAEWQVE
jgi:hypothetical protein